MAARASPHPGRLDTRLSARAARDLQRSGP